MFQNGIRQNDGVDEKQTHDETLEILQDEDLLVLLRESEKDVRAGRVSTLREVRRELGLG